MTKDTAVVILDGSFTGVVITAEKNAVTVRENDKGEFLVPQSAVNPQSFQVYRVIGW